MWFWLACAALADEVEEPGVPDRPLPWTRYVAPAVEGLAFNVSLNLTQRYVFDQEWAVIGVDSIRHNFETGWVWDQDLFSTNQFSHPYHGATLHNLARLNGLTYWESLPYAFLGSWHWEQFFETDPPSINDQVNTTLSGVLLGEMMWRASGRLLSVDGGSRALREAVALGIAPMRGLDRLLTGKAWRPAPDAVAAPLAHTLAVGYRGVGADQPDLVVGRIALAYGDLSARRPLDAFELSIEGQAWPSFERFGVEVFGTGALVGHAGGEHLVGLFQTYDYVQSPLLGVGGVGLGPGWWADVGVGGPWSLSIRATVMGMPTAAIRSPYASLVTDRDYLFGVGGTSAARLELRHRRLGAVHLEGRGYGVHSPIEPVGEEWLGFASVGAIAWIVPAAGAGVRGTLYGLRGTSREFAPRAEAFGVVEGTVLTAF